MRAGALVTPLVLALTAAIPAEARIPEIKEEPGTRLEIGAQLGGQGFRAVAGDAPDDLRSLLITEGKFDVTEASEVRQVFRRTVALTTAAGLAPGGTLYSADVGAGLMLGSRWIPSQYDPATPRGVRIAITGGVGIDGVSHVVPAALTLPVNVAWSTELLDRYWIRKGFRFEVAGRGEWVAAGRDRELGGTARVSLVWFQIVEPSWWRFEVRLGVMAKRYAGVNFAGGVLAIAFGGVAFFPCEASGPC